MDTLVDVKSLLNDPAFDINEISRQIPAARGIPTGGLFICHSGLDFRRIRASVGGVIQPRFEDGYFLHNRRSGGASRYKDLVRASLQWCDKFMVVVSRNSVGHDWVAAEVDWALRHHRPIICCVFDDADPSNVNPALGRGFPRTGGESSVFIVDFRNSLEAAQQRLGNILDALLIRAPYPRMGDLAEVSSTVAPHSECADGSFRTG